MAKLKSAKSKGTRWEHDLVTLLEKINKTWRRVAGSGALGTVLHESYLMGDVQGKVEGLSKSFIIEAKSGYGGATQLTIKKEWFDKVAEDANVVNAFPMVAAKFTNARSGTRYFVAIDVDVFVELMREVEGLYDELVSLYEKQTV
jgi:Holliday junction resolvase